MVDAMPRDVALNLLPHLTGRQRESDATSCSLNSGNPQDAPTCVQQLRKLQVSESQKPALHAD